MFQNVAKQLILYTYSITFCLFTGVELFMGRRENASGYRSEWKEYVFEIGKKRSLREHVSSILFTQHQKMRRHRVKYDMQKCARHVWAINNYVLSTLSVVWVKRILMLPKHMAIVCVCMSPCVLTLVNIMFFKGVWMKMQLRARIYQLYV